MDLKSIIAKIKIQQDLVTARYEDLLDDLIDDRQLQLADRVDSHLAKYNASINKLLVKLDPIIEKQYMLNDDLANKYKLIDKIFPEE